MKISGGLHAKLGAAAGLVVLHMMMGNWRREFEQDANTRSQKFYRYANEATPLLMILIIIMVELKPI